MRWLESEVACLPAGHAWARFSQGESEGLCSPVLELSAWVSWAERLPQLLESNAAEPLRHVFVPTSGRQTFRVMGPGGRQAVVKRYGSADIPVRPTDAPSLAYCWADKNVRAPNDPAAPARAFCRQIELHEAGQAVPEPLLFFAAGQEPQTRVCYSVSRALENCTVLVDFAFEHLHRRRSKLRRSLIWVEDVVRAIVGLHQAGYAHGDLHQHNVLVRSGAAAEHLEVFWTDFDACAQVTGPWPQEAQLLDLAMLGASLYRLVPDALLRRALVRYFAFSGLHGARRPQANLVIQDAFRSFLEESRKGFDIIEQACLAEAERRLAAGEGHSLTD